MSEMTTIQFNNGAIKMAGNLFFPQGFDDSRTYPAIVAVHPGGGVKEQTAGLYAEKLAQFGFVTMAFDASYQGESGGEPHFFDDPMRRTGDVFSAVDYLTSLSFVDADRIGALGICAGSGAAVKAASTERRIKALATVSAVDVGAATRRGWLGTDDESAQIANLEAVAKQRTAEAAGAGPLYWPYVPAVGDTSGPHDLQEAADYYLTSRGQHADAQNKFLSSSLNYMISFHAFDLVEKFLTQPLLVVAGTNAGSLWNSQDLYAIAPGIKELVLIEEATHMDLYDKRVDEVMTSLSRFFELNLGDAVNSRLTASTSSQSI